MHNTPFSLGVLASITWATLSRLVPSFSSYWKTRSKYKLAQISIDFALLLQPPTLTLPPPYDPQYKLQDGKLVTQELHGTLTAMIKQMNDAISSLSPLSSGIAAAA